MKIWTLLMRRGRRNNRFRKCCMLWTLIFFSANFLSNKKLQIHEEKDNEIEETLEETLETKTTHFTYTHKTAHLINDLKETLLTILRQTLDVYESCILLDLPGHENKGDLAISVGELNALHHINMPIDYFYPAYSGKIEYDPLKARLDARKTVVLAHGGGNIGTWPIADKYRAPALETFTDFKYVILSQSCSFSNKAHLNETKAQYQKHGNITVLLRDQPSFKFIEKNLQPARPVLAPDMAFAMGPFHRYFQPSLDVIWINRMDRERKLTCKPQFPSNITFLLTDWQQQFSSPLGRHIVDDSYIRTHNGFMFLQRAKVVVTDRLHGYILSTLLDIPVVIVDNRLKKLTNFRNTWAAGKDNAVVAEDVLDAVTKAVALVDASDTQRAPGF